MAQPRGLARAVIPSGGSGLWRSQPRLDLLQHHKERRHHGDGEQRRADHPGERCKADRLLRVGAGAARQYRRQKKFALGRPNGRYRLNELSSTSTSQIKHGAKSLDCDPGILACARNRTELVDSLSCTSKQRRPVFRVVRITSRMKLSRHFRMPRSTKLFEGQ